MKARIAVAVTSNCCSGVALGLDFMKGQKVRVSTLSFPHACRILHRSTKEGLQSDVGLMNTQTEDIPLAQGAGLIQMPGRLCVSSESRGPKG